MGEYYGKKILGGEVNRSTGEAWKVGDVRPLWRKRTEEWLEDRRQGRGEAPGE